jgi:hypothetical protein
VVTIAWDANSSVTAVESQKVAIVRIASTPATGWIILIMAFLPFWQARFGYATQMPGTATFWNRCGEATAEDG